MEGNNLKYSHLAAECQEADWNAEVYPVDVRCWGFVSRAMVQLFCESGMAGANLDKAVKELKEEAEKPAIGCGFGGRRMAAGVARTSHT